MNDKINPRPSGRGVVNTVKRYLSDLLRANAEELARIEAAPADHETKSFFGFGNAEASWRGPFAMQGEHGNWFQLGPLEDGWPRNLTTTRHGDSAGTVFACTSLISATTASLPLSIRRHLDDGSIVAVTDTDAARTLATPNDYQTPYQMQEGIATALLTRGNAYLLKLRNARYGISALIPLAPENVQAHVAPDGSGTALYYSIHPDDIFVHAESLPTMLVPQRDVIHFRINADPRDPLRGRAPLEYAAAARGLHQVVSAGLAAFHANRSRVGALLTSDSNLNKDQILQLKEAWANVAQGWAQGKTAVLPGGIKAVDTAAGANALDQQLVQLLQASAEDIARVFRVPPELVGLQQSSGRSAAEAARWLLATGLGSLLETIEQTLARGLELDPLREFVAHDVDYLMRTDPTAKWQAIETAVRSGALTINEARRREGLAPVAGGDQPLVQQQDLPLGMAADFAVANIDRIRREAERNNPPAAEPAPAPEPEPSSKDIIDAVRAKALDRVRQLRSAA